jgi:hypothetical protein
MKIPTLQGIIRRRVLLNYRAAPEFVQKILPKGFRPKLYQGKAIAGICLIRLEHIRPLHIPGFIGIASENAAHRLAVEWDDAGETKEGVFIPRRDTDSLLNQIAGGRLFPSEHHKAGFEIKEENGTIDFSMRSADGRVSVGFRGRPAEELSAGSIFPNLTEASRFFENGSLGYSSNQTVTHLDGIRLEIADWRAKPLEIEAVESSFYNDENIFPPDSIEFDHALLMENIEHRWQAAEDFELE